MGYPIDELERYFTDSIFLAKSFISSTMNITISRINKVMTGWSVYEIAFYCACC